MLRLNNAILFVRLSNNLFHVSLFPEFINVVSIMFYNFFEFIILLHSFLVISFAGHKGYTTCVISFSKVLEVLPAFTCTSAIGHF